MEMPHSNHPCFLQVGQEAWNGTKEAWNSTKGREHFLQLKKALR